jgi:8-oxo-dGDP phosphatase
MTHRYEVLESRLAFAGRVISVRSDVVRMPNEEQCQRDVVVHPGGVAVVALDNHDRVLLVEQYRHPVRRRLEEVPAGLLDTNGESTLAAAQRELVEEAGYAASMWDVLVDLLPDPAMTDEAIRVFLARDLRPVERDPQGHEEAEMTIRWEPLATSVQRVLRGDIRTAMASLGILAAAEARRNGFESLGRVGAQGRESLGGCRGVQPAAFE